MKSNKATIAVMKKAEVIDQWERECPQTAVPQAIEDMLPLERAIIVTTVKSSEADRKVVAAEETILTDAKVKQDLSSRKVADCKLGEIRFELAGIHFTSRFYEARPEVMQNITVALEMPYKNIERELSKLHANGASKAHFQRT